MKKITKMTDEQRGEFMYTVDRGIVDRAEEQGVDLIEAVHVIAGIALGDGCNVKPKRAAKRAMEIASQMELGGCVLAAELAEWVFNNTSGAVDMRRMEDELIAIYGRLETNASLIKWYKEKYQREYEEFEAEMEAEAFAAEKEAYDAALSSPYDEWEYTMPELHPNWPATSPFRYEKLQPAAGSEGLVNAGVPWPF